MKSIARSYVWWPRLDKEIEQAAKELVTRMSVSQECPNCSTVASMDLAGETMAEAAHRFCGAISTKDVLCARRRSLQNGRR
jgi:hypothetical protein